MADYKVTDTELTSIANAIRTKGGTSAQLEFPTGFVSAVQAIPTGGGDERAVEYELLNYLLCDGTYRFVLPLKWDETMSNVETFIDFETDSYLGDNPLFGNNGAPGWSYTNIVTYNNAWTSKAGDIHAYESGRHSIRATPTEIYYDKVLAKSSTSFYVVSASLDIILFGRTGSSSSQWTQRNFTGKLYRFYIKDLTTGNYIVDFKPANIKLNNRTVANGLVDIVNGFFYSDYPAV